VLDQFISRRHEQHVDSEGERDEEAAWRESERRTEAARREENRQAWCEHHADQAERLRATLADLVAYHEAEAEKHLTQKGSRA